MPLNYEPLDINTDVTTTRTLLHEVIPLTGTIVSGTYSDNNIKNYTHGMFQSVYDYPYLSSSANHIFDITMGFTAGATVSGRGLTMSASCAASGVQNSKKLNTYTQFAQTLLGYKNSAGNEVEIFESDLDITDDTNQMTSCYFITLSRLIMKEQIKKGSFSMTIGTGSFASGLATTGSSGTSLNKAMEIVLHDVSASAGTSGEFKSGLPGGDYGILYVSGASPVTASGVIFYQAGVIVLSSSFMANPYNITGAAFTGAPYWKVGATNMNVQSTFITASMSGACDALRRRIRNISFNNTTEINSKIYFCRVPHNKYNYSANPTYTKDSKIQVKDLASDPPLSYITTVGLYNSSNELLAVAKVSEPLKKDPTNELTLRVRLDY